MKCERIRELLSPYIDKMTDKNETMEVEAHLQGCPLCSDELKQLRSLCALMISLESPLPPLKFSQDLHQRLLEENRNAGSIRSAKSWWRTGRIAAAVAGLAMALGIYANSIMPIGNLAFWNNKPDDNQKPPVVAIGEQNVPVAPIKDNVVGTGVNSPDAVAPGSPVNVPSNVGSETNPPVTSDNPNITEPVAPVATPRVAVQYSTALKVDNAGDSLARVIQIADASGAEFVSTTNLSAQVMAGTTTTKELVVKIEKSQADEFITQLGAVGKVSAPVYQEQVLTDKYNEITSQINLLQQEKQALEVQPDISSADQLKLAEYDRQLNTQLSQKNQLEKELNTVKVTIQIIQQVQP